MTTLAPSTARRTRQMQRIEMDDEQAYRLSGGGKRHDESGTFDIPAYTYRRDPWEREFLKRVLTPPGAQLSKPLYQPDRSAFEFEWKRTRFEVKG